MKSSSKFWHWIKSAIIAIKYLRAFTHTALCPNYPSAIDQDQIHNCNIQWRWWDLWRKNASWCEYAGQGMNTLQWKANSEFCKGDKMLIPSNNTRVWRIDYQIGASCFCQNEKDVQWLPEREAHFCASMGPAKDSQILCRPCGSILKCSNCSYLLFFHNSIKTGMPTMWYTTCVSLAT